MDSKLQIRRQNETQQSNHASLSLQGQRSLSQPLVRSQSTRGLYPAPGMMQAPLGRQLASGNTNSGSSAHVDSVPAVGQKRERPQEDQNGQSANKKRKYGLGQHGAKTSEQKRLTAQYGVKVSGETHQSEHAIGFEVINRTSGEQRGKPGRARYLENTAPAYQETYQEHRDHVGTGTKNSEDESGFNSTSYRDAQRKLLEHHDLSSAVQLNQLGYAFNREFQRKSGTREGQAANDSYEAMVNNMNELTFANGSDNETVTTTSFEREEMRLARKTAQTGKWPSQEEIQQARDNAIRSEEQGREPTRANN
ncbi:MAG: hypothetical protein QNJ54_16805 [Prochloraceae cyanobacterium]|nr:hypothetical protein [Prochloraceae cyanobacterium]